MLMKQPSSRGGHLFGGDPNIEALQRALLNLSQASGRPAINPGAVSGVLTDATMAAVVAAHGILTEELPSWMYLALQAALIAGSTTSQAKAIVTQYAGQLAMAANTAAAKLHPGGTATGGTIRLPNGTVVNVNAAAGNTITAASDSPFTLPGSVSEFFAPGWYKTPMGIALLLLVGFGVYKFFLAPPSRAVSAA